MSICTKILPILALSVSLLSGHTARSEDALNPGRILATVNGVEITLGHMLALRAGLPEQYSEVSPEVLFKGILDQLVQQTLLMQSIKDKPSLRTTLLIENERRAIIASEAIDKAMGSPLEESALKAAYDAKYSGPSTETEYRAAHILVEAEEEAKALELELQDGADFADLAKKHSVGPSGPAGGALGWFGAGVMVEPFFEAVVSLEPGQVSSPVQTQFGWHVIKLEETRIKEHPAFKDVRDNLENELRQSSFDNLIKKLESAAKIERINPEDFDPTIVNRTDLLEK